MKAILPTRSIGLLIGIGLVDMIATAWLHANGLVVEMNPLMKPFLATGEWLFIFVKSLTLIAAWIVMVRFARTHRAFVRTICLWGSAGYLSIWLGWFLIGMASSPA